MKGILSKEEIGRGKKGKHGICDFIGVASLLRRKKLQDVFAAVLQFNCDVGRFSANLGLTKKNLVAPEGLFKGRGVGRVGFMQGRNGLGV